MGESNGAVQALAAHRAQMSVLGYEPPWPGIVKAKPSPHDLHALITPPEHLDLTRKRPNSERVLSIYGNGTGFSDSVRK